MAMPATTALVSVSVIPTEIVGMTPAKAVVRNRPMVVGRLASQTSRRTCGSAAVVPTTDCLRLSHRPRRSLGPSGCCGGSIVGSPVRPLLAGPLSGLRRPAPQPPHPVPGPWAAGRIARFREETRGHRIGIAREAEERFKKYVTWGAKLDGVTKRFNPGGGGRGGDDRRSVMIRRWMRRHRGRHGQQAEVESQVF